MQVEAALVAEPGNEELQKLKQDLLEVIHITEELSSDQQGGGAEADANGEDGPASSSTFSQWKVPGLNFRRNWLCYDLRLWGSYAYICFECRLETDVWLLRLRTSSITNQ